MQLCVLFFVYLLSIVVFDNAKGSVLPMQSDQWEKASRNLLQTAAICVAKTVKDELFVERLLKKIDKSCCADLINSPCECGLTPFHHAVLAGNRKVVEFFISRGANFDVRVQTERSNPYNELDAWQLAGLVIPYYGRVIYDLIDTKDSERSKVVNDIVHCAKIGHYEGVLNLIEKDETDINQKDERDNTALFYAVDNRDFYLVKLLVAHGADYWLRGHHSYSAYSWAHKKEYNCIIDFFDEDNRITSGLQ